MSEGVFIEYSRYYDLLYRDKDYIVETNYIIDTLKRFEVSGKQLLEFGSGTGKHGRLLAEHGYHVTGIERSPEMVSQAELIPGFSCQQGDICKVQIGRKFDAVLSLFHVVSYQVTNAEVLAVFERAADHLSDGGLFVFDVWFSPAVYANRPEVRVKRVKDDFLEITRIAEPLSHPIENCVDINYTIFARDLAHGIVKTMTETHPMRHFSLPELNLIAQVSGFEILIAEEFLTGNQPGENTWSVCFVLKKKSEL